MGLKTYVLWILGSVFIYLFFTFLFPNIFSVDKVGEGCFAIIIITVLHIATEMGDFNFCQFVKECDGKIWHNKKLKNRNE